ncbi:MAG: preprotein translocase subunit SecG [Syntrophobacterales bacterium]|nr:MAG: preprotein translocase subunit SecG [Syntrophobacterales bacterium]
MITGLFLLHIFVCVALILIVLLQAGKGASIGAAFGGASQTIFGSPGAAGFLTKITTVAAIIFMITSIFLTMLSGPRSSTVLEETKTEVTETFPSEEALPTPGEEEQRPEAELPSEKPGQR